MRMQPTVAPSRSSHTGKRHFDRRDQVDGFANVFAFCSSGGSKHCTEQKAGNDKTLSWLEHCGALGGSRDARANGGSILGKAEPTVELPRAAAVLCARKKIEPDPANPIYILTVRGVGYKFNIKEGTAHVQR